ncbi:MAG: hypothetical protein ACP5JD_06900 [Candidatus Bipolaricaulaceae bacterium]
MRRSVFWWGAVLGVLALSFTGTGLAQTMELGDTIYIGERFPVTLHVADTLVVLNLTNPAKVYEFKMDQPGTIELCFVRPCDHPCACVPVERVILANPGDEILFVLKGNPKGGEVRRPVVRAREDKPKIQAELVERDGKCRIKIAVDLMSADLTCSPDKIPALFYVQDEGKAIELELLETGPTTGKFEAEMLIEIAYEKGKFIVSYECKGKPESVVVTLPELPKATIKVGGEAHVLDLVSLIPDNVMEKIPEKFRLDCCSLTMEWIRGIVQASFPPSAQVFLEVIADKLYAIVRDGCRYQAGIKDVEVLEPVKLMVEDEKGASVQGGRLEAGKKYIIKAINGLEDGIILVVELGCSTAKPVLKSVKGTTTEWTPDQELSERTVAIIYVDQYFCNPPALIFSID